MLRLQFSSSASATPLVMKRSNSSRSIALRSKPSAQDGVLSDTASLLEQQSSNNTPPQQPHSQVQHSWATRTLSAINESTKWTVSAAVFGVLLYHHNEYAAWCVVGAVLSSFLCKVLKHVVNQQRPDNAQKSDPGMPSSHANSLNFLAVYAALSLDYHTRSNPTAVALAGGTLLLGAFLTWLRVRLGYHTWPQVLVGAGLGASTAAAWFAAGTKAGLPALRQAPMGMPALYAVTLLAMAAFAVRNVLAWAEERQQKKLLQQQQQQELLELQQKLQSSMATAEQQPMDVAVPQSAVMATALAN